MNRPTTEQGRDTREKIYGYVVDYIAEHGYSPTVREIADGVYLSSSSAVHNQLIRMFAEGTLETDAKTGTPRAIRVPGYQFVKEG